MCCLNKIFSRLLRDSTTQYVHPSVVLSVRACFIILKVTRLKLKVQYGNVFFALFAKKSFLHLYARVDARDDVLMNSFPENVGLKYTKLKTSSKTHPSTGTFLVLSVLHELPLSNFAFLRVPAFLVGR